MSVSERLKTSVKARDISAIRDCLWSRLVLDPNFTKGFPESWKYCLDNGIIESELYEPHDGRPLPENVSDDNFSALSGQLSTNFSRERLNAIKRIGRALYPPKSDEGYDTVSASSGGSRAHLVRQIVVASAAAALGVAVGGAVGGFLLRRALMGAIVGGVAGGVAGVLLGNRKRTDISR